MYSLLHALHGEVEFQVDSDGGKRKKDEYILFHDM